MKNLNIIKLFAMAAIALVVLVSCSDKVHRDDAIRIKKESAWKYNKNPHTEKLRSGNTLRGEAVKIEIMGYPDSCPVTDETKYTYKGELIFVDSTSDDSETERIPLADIDAVGQKMDIAPNEYGNINYFETYNSPLLPLALRAIPVDTLRLDTCNIPCPCEKINLDLDMPCFFCFTCPDRKLTDVFFELKGGYALYKDYNKFAEKVGKDDWLIDAAIGFRFGKAKRWGLGLIFSTGVKTQNLLDSDSYKRPMIGLYGRYDLTRDKKKLISYDKKIDTIKITNDIMEYDTIKTVTADRCRDSIVIVSRIKPTELQKYQEKMQEKFKEIEVRPCLNPFVYAFVGTTMDKNSLDLYRLQYSDGCKEKVNIDVNLPLNYGVGIGFDYAVASFLDFSADIGIRSIAYGDQTVSNGLLAPIGRRLNAVVLRIGVTY